MALKGCEVWRAEDGLKPVLLAVGLAPGVDIRDGITHGSCDIGWISLLCVSMQFEFLGYFICKMECRDTNNVINKH